MPIGPPIDLTPCRTRPGRTALPPLLLLLLGASAVAGCSDEPGEPGRQVILAAPALDLQPADPAVVCGRQGTTEVTVRGRGFAPRLPARQEGDAGGLPDPELVRWPELELLRTQQVDGTPLGPTEFDRARFASDGGGSNGHHLSWGNTTQLTLVLDQQLALASGPAETPRLPAGLPPGSYDLLVTNPDGSSASSPGALAVIDPPRSAGPSPGLVCLAEEARTVTLSGQGLLEFDGATPTVLCGGLELPLHPLDECTPLAGTGRRGKLCRAGEFTLEQAAVDAGNHELTVRNPAPAACVSEERTSLRVVAPPHLDALLPPLVCTAQGGPELALRGDELLVIDGVLPAVSITTASGTAQEVEVIGAGPGCLELETMGHEVQSCSELIVRLPDLDPTDPYAPTLALRNPAPAGCSARASGEQVVLIVPPPTLVALDPPRPAGPLGRATLHGRNLIVADGVAPTVTIDGVPLPPAAVMPQDCVALPVQGILASACNELELQLDPARLDDGQARIAVTNPQPAGCSATLE